MYRSLIAIAILTGCQTVSTSQTTTTPSEGDHPGHSRFADDVQTQEAISCNEGEEFLPFTIEPADNLHTPGALGFRSSHVFVPPQDGHVRFNICLGDTARLLSVTWKQSSLSAPETFPWPADREPTGLAEAMEREHASLSLTIPRGEPTRQLIVKGFEQGNFVAIYPVMVEDGEQRHTSRDLLAGRMVVGDPFANRRCPDWQNLNNSSFTLGTAKFTTEQCQYLGGGQTTGWDFIKVVIEDNGASPPVNVTLEGEELADRLVSRYNHHNGCDSFVIRLDDATYAATSAAPAGCGEIVDGAPPRDQTDQRASVLYRITYGDRTINAETPCIHFLWGCNAEPEPVDPNAASALSWTYTGHGWNTVDAQANGVRAVFDTPEGDDDNDRRNLTFGWRPLIGYNRVTINSPQGNFVATRWADQYDGNEYWTKDFCQHVTTHLREGEETVSLAEFARRTEIVGANVGGACDLQISRPGTYRSSLRREESLQDMICIAPPQVGLGFVAVYMQFVRLDHEPFPYLSQWPGKASLCVDGVVTDLEVEAP